MLPPMQLRNLDRWVQVDLLVVLHPHQWICLRPSPRQRSLLPTQPPAE